jgi:hypothetical protein
MRWANEQTKTPEKVNPGFSVGVKKCFDREGIMMKWPWADTA